MRSLGFASPHGNPTRSRSTCWHSGTRRAPVSPATLTCGNARGPASARTAFPAAARRVVAPTERVAVQMLRENQRAPDNGPVIFPSDTFDFYSSGWRKPTGCDRIALGPEGRSRHLHKLQIRASAQRRKNFQASRREPWRTGTSTRAPV